MTINLSIRHYRVSVGGLDCTPALISFQGSDSKIDQGGLVIFTGTIVLGRPDGFESLDDRINNRWARGQKIVVEIAKRPDSEPFNLADLLERSPRGGEIYILDSQFDLKTRKLTLHTGDLFELLKIREPRGDASKVCAGTSTSRTEVVNRLLLAAGAPPLIDSIPGFLNSPTPKAFEGSFIEQAGAIAAAAGYFIWMDSLGRSRASAIDAKQSAPLIAFDLTAQAADYQRLEGEQPAERVIVNGKATITRQSRDGTETLTEEFGPASAAGSSSDANTLIKRTFQRDSFSRSSKLRTIETTIEEAAGIVLSDDPDYEGSTSLVVSEFRRETYKYEANSPVMGSAGQPGCQQGNQGRLKTHAIEITRPRAVVFREVYASYPRDGDGRLEIDINKFEPVFAESEQTDYVYDPGRAVLTSGDVSEDDLPLLEALGRGPRITTTKKAPIGTIIPTEFAYDPDRIVFNMERPVPSESNIQFWKEKNFGEWSYEQTIRKPLATVFPQVADKLRERRENDEITYDPAILVALVAAQNTLTISRSGQAQPPAPETYSPEFSSEEVTVKGKANFPVDIDSPYRPREKTLSFDYLNGGTVAAAQEEANQLAQTWGVVLWGHHKGASITTDLSNSWFDYEPMKRGDVTELEGVSAYLMDGFSIAMAEKRCICSFDGIFLGWTQAENPDQISPPYRLNQEVELQASAAADYRLSILTSDPVSIDYSVQVSAMVSYRTLTEGYRFDVQGSASVKYQQSFKAVKVQGSAATAWARSINWDEITFEQWRNMTDFQWTKIYPPGS
jgi:hypothetical protein